jgi:long-chain fatty acid transport protein
VKPVLLLLGYELSLYYVYAEDRLVGDQGTTIVVTRNYRNGNILRAGVEWEAIPGLQLRLGGLRDWSGVRSVFYSATIPTDGNAWVVSGGAGWDLGRTGWDFLKDVTANFGVFYAWVGPVHVPSDSAELLGSFKTNALLVSAGITYRNDLSFLKH